MGTGDIFISEVINYEQLRFTVMGLESPKFTSVIMKIIFPSLVLLVLLTSAEENCEDFLCSNIIDYVCGMARTWDGAMVISKYQNICHLKKIQCRLQSIVEIKRVPDVLCHIKRKRSIHYNISGRRLTDFSIVGAHQACNHTCPTYCVDTYEPACAQIWKRGMKKYSFRPMINHCHIDLFSCAVGVNVTIQPLGKCYNNPSGLLFMSQVAAMKSLQLLDDTPVDLNYNTKIIGPAAFSRRSNDGVDWQIENLLKILIN